MKRYALQELMAWKERARRKPLLVEGARQVGKTWLMRELAKSFPKSAYLNFNDQVTAREVFEGDLSVERIMRDIGALCGIDVSPGDTLIILDEIQESERALNALKFLRENAPELHVIAAGSLLGVAMRHRHMSFPVGQVEFLRLHPLSFREFLEAVDESRLESLLRSGDVRPTFRSRFIDLLKLYMYVGGMPEAVVEYAESRSLPRVREVQRQILSSYGNDFAKYTDATSVARISAVWRSIPEQLAKENRRFAYGKVSPGGRGRDYEAAIDWLTLCGLVYKVERVAKPCLPLLHYARSSAFKLFLLDTGLMGAMAGLEPRTIIGETPLFEEFRGALTEQYVHQCLARMPELSISYWANDSGAAEVDFLVQHEGEIIPIEVKATTNLQSKSLRTYCAKFSPSVAIRTSLGGFGVANGIYSIPLYLMEDFPTLLRQHKGGLTER